jgi:hypothetical protein
MFENVGREQDVVSAVRHWKVVFSGAWVGQLRIISDVEGVPNEVLSAHDFAVGGGESIWPDFKNAKAVLEEVGGVGLEKKFAIGVHGWLAAEEYRLSHAKALELLGLSAVSHLLDEAASIGRKFVLSGGNQGVL